MKKTVRQWCKLRGMDELSTDMICHFARRVGIFEVSKIDERLFDALLYVFIDRIVENLK